MLVKLGGSLKGSSRIFSGFERNCDYSESFETLIMLRYAMCVIVNIIFIHFDIWREIYRHTCLAPEGIKKSISGPRPKKVVHNSRPTDVSLLLLIFSITVSSVQVLLLSSYG